MKSFGIFMVCAIFTSSPFTAFAQTVALREAINDTASYFQSRIAQNDIVAVVNFEFTSPRFSDKIIDDLIGELLERNVRVVTRKDLDDIHNEQNYQASGYVDDNSAVGIGHELGASVIIKGTGQNMGEYIQTEFRALRVGTGEMIGRRRSNIRNDSEVTRIIKGTSGIGSTHFLVGARLGAGFEINTADEDMVGGGYSPKEKSNTVFAGSLFGAFKFNEALAVQAELIFMLNNGMEISGHGSVISIEYPTLDIPLLFRWNFIQTPVLAGIVLGPHISLPIGKLNLSAGDKGSALDMADYSLGAAGGITLGIKAGPGYITGDLRFLHDFSSLKVREDFGDGMRDANICIRRSINLTMGYELSL